MTQEQLDALRIKEGRLLTEDLNNDEIVLKLKDKRFAILAAYQEALKEKGISEQVHTSLMQLNFVMWANNVFSPYEDRNKELQTQVDTLTIMLEDLKAENAELKATTDPTECILVEFTDAEGVVKTNAVLDARVVNDMIVAFGKKGVTIKIMPIVSCFGNTN
jgi:hypothetical protein